ncbi:MAG: hypothetical protein WDO56_12285 [Gammaproteobacteria bacterium]
MSGARLTRRDFVARVAAAGSLAGAVPALSLARAVAPVTSAAAPRIRAAVPVVSFHLDRPYLDLSGEAIPYLPPAGARGAAPIALLGEADLFRLPL